MTNEDCWSFPPAIISTLKLGDIWPLFEASQNPLQPDFNDIAAMARKFQATPSECRGGANDGNLSGPGVTAWCFVICGSVIVVSGQQTIFTVDDGKQNGRLSDFCITPFNTNPFFLLGGFFVAPINYGLPPFCWGIES